MPTSFFVSQEQSEGKRTHKKRRTVTPHVSGVARVSYVAKAKILNDITQSIVTGNSDTFKQRLESAMTIFSMEARVSDAQIRKLRQAISTIHLDKNEDDTKMLSTGDVAKKLGVSNQAVINWIEADKMKAFRSPGGHYRIPSDQFRTTDEQDATSEAIFEKLWAKREGMPTVDEDDLGDL